MGFSAAEQVQTATAQRAMAGLAMALLAFSLAGCGGGSTPKAKVVSQTFSGKLTTTTKTSMPGADHSSSGTMSMAMDADSGAMSSSTEVSSHAPGNVSIHASVRIIYDPKNRNLTQFKKTTIAGAPPIVQTSCTWHLVQPESAIDQVPLGVLTSHLQAISMSGPPTPGGLSPVPCDKSPLKCLQDAYANLTYKGADGDNSVFNLDMHVEATPTTGPITVHEEFTFDPENLMRKLVYTMATSAPLPNKSVMQITSGMDLSVDSAKGGKPDASNFVVPSGWPACVPAPSSMAAHKTMAALQKAIVV